MAENNIPPTDVTSAVKTIKTAILQSQERAVKAVNQEQLALYYGIGRFISVNTRNKYWEQATGVTLKQKSKKTDNLTPHEKCRI